MTIKTEEEQQSPGRLKRWGVKLTKGRRKRGTSGEIPLPADDTEHNHDEEEDGHYSDDPRQALLPDSARESAETEATEKVSNLFVPFLDGDDMVKSVSDNLVPCSSSDDDNVKTQQTRINNIRSQGNILPNVLINKSANGISNNINDNELQQQETFEEVDGIECEILTDSEGEAEMKVCDDDEGEDDEEYDNNNLDEDNIRDEGYSDEDVMSPNEGSTYQSPPSSPNGNYRRFRRPRIFKKSPKKSKATVSIAAVDSTGESPPAKEKSSWQKIGLSDGLYPRTPLRTMRALTLGTSKQTRPSMTNTIEWDQEGASGALDELSSGASSFDDESEMFDDDLDDDTLGEDMEQPVDFSTLSYLPNSFLNVAPDSYDYLDISLVNQISEQDISCFAWEHHLMVKGLLHLLAERDHIGVEDDVHDQSNIIKMGPLKKKFTQLWRVKYVEIRKGNLSYYEDSKKNELNSRKIIHLRKHTCQCRTVKDSTGFVFELITEDGLKGTWMAKSEEERQGWIRAINQAMIGENDEGSGLPLDVTPYQTSLDVYTTVQESLKSALTLQEYLMPIESNIFRKLSTSSLKVPVEWIRQEIISEEESTSKPGDAAQKRLKSSISDFWKNLKNTSALINGHLVEANTAYSAERILGALSRCILEFDKGKSVQLDTITSMSERSSSLRKLGTEGSMSEIDAVSYARSILVSSLRSKNRGESHAAFTQLCTNNELVAITLESSDPLQIDVSYAGDDFSEYEHARNDVAGWISTRTKKTKNWKGRYFVISEGVLSYYENANPRPYGLRGQLVLRGASLDAPEEKILQIQRKDDDRLLRFESNDDFQRWQDAIQRAIDSVQPSGETEKESGSELRQQKKPATSSRSRAVKKVIKATEGGMKAVKGAAEGGMKAVKGAAGGGIKAIKGATAPGIKAVKGAKDVGMKSIKGAREAGMKSIKGASDLFSRGIRGGTRKRPQLDMLISSTRNVQVADEKREPTVQVVIEWSNVYKITPAQDAESTLLYVRVKQFQAFLLSGGTNGRLLRGDQLIGMEFSGGESFEGVDHNYLEAPTEL